MAKKIINAILGVLTLALIVVGFIFMLQNAGKNTILFFAFLTMHILGWIMITVTVALFTFVKATTKKKAKEITENK